MEGVDLKATTSPMRSLERSFELLRILRQSRVPLRLSDLARESGIHLATTQRILNVMLQYGYVNLDNMGYTIGITSVLNAFMFLVTNSLSRIALPILQELTTSIDLTSSLSVRVDFEQVMILRVEGTSPLRYRLPVGEPMPLHLGGARVLAAALEPEDLAKFLAAVPEIRLANSEVVTNEEFVESLRVIGQQGHVYGYSQRELGAASVAVPVVDHGGAVVASLQVSGLSEDLDPSKVEWCIVELKVASAAITKRLP